jgi:hypothetical protein
MTQRNIAISDRSRCKLLHIEAPGCIINIRVGLTDTDGRKVTNVSIEADGDRYVGDPEWWIDAGDGKWSRSGGARVVCAEYKGESA